MELLKSTFEIINAIADILTIATSILAIYIYVTKKDDIKTAFNLLINYSFQTTLGELNEKLELLNHYSASDPADIETIKNILHEIAGQLRGNDRLREKTATLTTKIERLADSKKFSEPNKRSLVSELREVLKNISIENQTATDGM